MFLISSHSLRAANSVHTGWDLGTDWRSLQWNVMWLFPLGLMSTSWLHFTLMAWTRRSRHGRQGSPLPARTPHSLIEGCFDSGSRSTLPHAPCDANPAARHTAPSWDFQEILQYKAIKQNCVRFWRLAPGHEAMTRVFPRLIWVIVVAQWSSIKTWLRHARYTCFYLFHSI